MRDVRPACGNATRFSQRSAQVADTPLGVDGAFSALKFERSVEDDRIEQKSLALEQARYEVARARRQYDAVDATNRLVAAELERRWNVALRTQAALEEELEALRTQRTACLSEEQRRTLLELGTELRRLWEHPRSQPEWKKRIVRALMIEIVVTAERPEIRLYPRLPITLEAIPGS